MRHLRFSLAFMAACALLCAGSYGQSGGGYLISRSAVGAGTEAVGGGAYALGGSVGQPEAGTVSGGGYALTGGVQATGVGASDLGVGDDVCSGGSNNGGSCGTSADCPGGTCGLKSRYLSIRAATGGDPMTIQVTIVDIDDALGMDAREGDVWWAAGTQAVPNPPHVSLAGAALECNPVVVHAENWPFGVLHLFGAAIVPGSIYEVRMCDAGGADCSAPLTVATGRWGDSVAAFGDIGQPNFADITALVDKFKDAPNAPHTPRTDLVPEIPNQSTNFADITADVDAFKEAVYPYTIPACP